MWSDGLCHAVTQSVHSRFQCVTSQKKPESFSHLLFTQVLDSLSLASPLQARTLHPPKILFLPVAKQQSWWCWCCCCCCAELLPVNSWVGALCNELPRQWESETRQPKITQSDLHKRDAVTSVGDEEGVEKKVFHSEWKKCFQGVEIADGHRSLSLWTSFSWCWSQNKKGMALTLTF